MTMGHSLPQYTGNLLFQAFILNGTVMYQNNLKQDWQIVCSIGPGRYVLILIFSTKKSNSSNQPWLLMDIPPIFLTVAQIDS